jgi:mitogen-activated protein kinase 15
VQFNPNKRLSASEALRHPYVAAFAAADDDMVAKGAITTCINDNHKYSISEYRDKLYSEILRRKKELHEKMKAREARKALAASGGGSSSGYGQVQRKSSTGVGRRSSSSSSGVKDAPAGSHSSSGMIAARR